MSCSNWILLLCQVTAEIFVTFILINWEFIRWLIPRRRKNVKEQIVLVTGAGHGIGRRIAIQMGRLQATVVCWDIDAQLNASTVNDIKKIGGNAVSYTVDVSDRKQVMKTAKELEEQVGHVTMLINNVGIYPVKAILDWNQHELSELFEKNLYSHFWTFQAFLPGMIARNCGHVVAISSAAAIAPVASEVPYSASKAAVTALMEGLQQEMYFNKDCKLKFTTVHPYYTATRTDLPVKFEIRFGRLDPDYVAAKIVEGILQEREMITVPFFMQFWLHFLRCLPQMARHRWRQVFYTRVYPEINSSKHEMEDKRPPIEGMNESTKLKENSTTILMAGNSSKYDSHCYVNEGNTIQELQNTNTNINASQNGSSDENQTRSQIINIRL